MKELLESLERWLAQHRKAFHKNLQPGASAAELDALGKHLGKALPAGLRTLLGWHNGQGDAYVGYLENHWLLMSTASIAAAKVELDAAEVEGWKKEWIPFLDDDGGDFLVLDTSQAEPPVLAFYVGKPQASKVAPSLEAWLKDFVAAVEGGGYREDTERGIFAKRQKPSN